jgi:hypothetical protein
MEKEPVSSRKFDWLVPVVGALLVNIFMPVLFLLLWRPNNMQCTLLSSVGFNYDNEILVKNLTLYLDELQKVFSWAIVIFAGLLWATLSKDDRLSIVGFSIKKKYAFRFAAIMYLLAITAIWVLFIRVGDTLCLVGEDNSQRAITAITTHSWLLNPFVFFEGSPFSPIQSSLSILITSSLWLFIVISLIMLAKLGENIVETIVIFSFMSIPAALIPWSLLRVIFIINSKNYTIGNPSPTFIIAGFVLFLVVYFYLLFTKVRDVWHEK